MSLSTTSQSLPEMVTVPAGTFLMGTSDKQVERMAASTDWAKEWIAKGYFSREQPQHAVALSQYRIGKYPVTVAQYAKFIEAGGYQKRHCWTEAGWQWLQTQHRTNPDLWTDSTWTGRSNLPLVGVTWYEAWAYCAWLSEKTGRFYRLPDEAEWEKAARGTDGRTYPWGDYSATDRLNAQASGIRRTVPVDFYVPAGNSPYGCVQMLGNVSEWTLTLFRRYPYDACDGRNDPQGQGERVIRGGSWFSPAFRTRTSARGMNDPHFSDNDVGFRCLCEED